MASISIVNQEWVPSTQRYTITFDLTWSESEGYSHPYTIYYYHGKNIAKSGSVSGYIYNGSYTCTIEMSGLLPYLKFTFVFLGSERVFSVKPHPDHYSDSCYPSYYPTMQRQWYQYNFNTFSNRGDTWCCVANTLASCREKIEHDIRPTSQTKYSVSWIYGGVNQSNDEWGGLLYVDTLEFMKVVGTPNARKIKKVNVNGYPDIYRKQTTTTTYNGVTETIMGAVERYNSLSPSQYSSYGKISDYKRIEWIDIYDVMTYVDNSKYGTNNAVFITIEITDEFDNANKNVGVISKGVCPRLTQTSANRGGHSMIILGWKKINDEYYWICQNSWGYKYDPSGTSLWNEASWVETGDNGLIYIPVSWSPRQTNDVWNGGIYGYYVVFGGDYGSDAFKWDTPKTKGGTFNITASEWTKLQNYINECLGYINKSAYPFTKVSKGQTFLASHFSEVKEAIYNSPYLNSNIGILTAIKGEPIKAGEQMNKLVESLNSVT